MILRRYLTSVLMCFSLFALSACGQSMLEHKTFTQGNLDSVDLDTLAVQLTLPVISKPGRGVSTSFATSYSSNFWSIVSTQWVQSSYFGWNADILSYAGAFDITGYSQTVCSPANDDHDDFYDYDYYGRTYTDAYGIRHDFPGDSTDSDCNGGSHTDFPAWATSTDGYSIDASNNVYNQHGTIVDFGKIQDNNGNSLQYTSGSTCSPLGTAGCFVDTTGTPALASDGSLGGSAPIHYYYLDSTGTKQTATLSMSAYTVRTNFGLPGVSEFGPHTYYLPSSFSSPNGTYTFTYEATPGYAGSVTGRLASVTLPTGGVVQYSFPGASGSENADGTLSAVTRTTTDGAISFTRVNPTSTTAHTVVQFPSGRSDAYDFAKVEPTWIHNAYVTTGVTSGGVSTSICYSGSPGYAPSYTCATDGISWPVNQRKSTTTLDNGLLRNVTEFFNASIETTEIDETDFGTSSPTTARQTLLTYAVWDRVQQASIKDGSGNLISQTSYYYDEGTLVPTSGLANHAAPTTPRANLTRVAAWDSSSGSTLETRYTYDDAGQLQTISGPGPGQTTFSYDATDTFVTSVMSPTVNGIALTRGTTHELNSGALTSSTDENGHETDFVYDNAQRLLSVTRTAASGGDGSVTTYSYPTRTQFSRSETIGNGSSTDHEAFTDPYGRQIRSAEFEGSSTWRISDTCYNSDGRLSFQSLPYTATSLTGTQVCSGAGDSYAYDSYGRRSSVTHADGSQVQYAYAGRTVKITDEGANGTYNIRTVQDDGFGRVAAVCEYSNGAGMFGSATPTACGSDLNASGPDAGKTGFVSLYTYDLANHKVTSSQSGQQRVWQYDSLGRLTSEQVPERKGLTTFSYSFDSIGLLTTRTRVGPNQLWTTASPSYVTTSAQDDALGRPQSVSYDDGATPTVTYSYDTGTVTPASHNMLGEVATASVGANIEQFSYNSNGQIEWMRTCLASTCSAASPTYVQQSFSYNYLGSITSANDGALNSVGYTFDPEGRLSSVNESLVDSTHPASLLSGLHYGAFGASSMTYGNGLTAQFGFDLRGRLNSTQVSTAVNANIYSYSLSWGANGSLVHSVDSQNDTWSYGYDEFNRLKSTGRDSGTQTIKYNYDAWGNRWFQRITVGSGTTVNSNFDAYNHNSNFVYYADGSVASDGVHTYTYDAEERVHTVDGTTTYTYGPDGSRIQVQKSTGTRDFIYRPDGQLSSVWSSGSLIKANLYVEGGKLGSYNAGGVSFEYADWTGSTRVVADGTGNVLATYSSVPFGMPSPATGGSDKQQVSGLDWDDESYTGHAWARQYSPTSGQWMAPDPFPGSYDLTNPQSLNRYAYVGNDPMSYNDPLGLARSSASPDFDGFFGGASGSSGGGPTGCQVGAGDVCRAVVVAWKWLESLLGSPKSNNNSPGTGRAPDNGAPSNEMDGLEALLYRQVMPGGPHHTVQNAPAQQRVPTRFTIRPEQEPPTKHSRTYHYQLMDQNGKPLKCNACGWKEKIDPQKATGIFAPYLTQHGLTSEDRFIPMIQGIAADDIGLASDPRRGENGTYKVNQTFSIQYNGQVFPLTTMMSHTIVVTNGVLTSATAEITKP